MFSPSERPVVTSTRFGWDSGVATMHKGEKATLICRSDYAYGEHGSPPKIPGGATLNFEVELFSWKEKVKPPHLMTAEERSAHAEKMKEAGTLAFKAQDWATAVNRYEDRCLCLLKGSYYYYFNIFSGLSMLCFLCPT